MTLPRSTDAAFFDLVHELLNEQAGPLAGEHRHEGRHPYECVQLLAPYDGENLPQQADFRPVRCHDISPHGFSFYTPVRPQCERVVIALGEIPFKFFAAEVRHVRAVEISGRKRYLAGCRFLRRIGAS